jgi:nucleosome assembly protein 1-like 1
MDIQKNFTNSHRPHRAKDKVAPTPSNTPVPLTPIRQKGFAPNLQGVAEEPRGMASDKRMLAAVERQLRHLDTADREPIIVESSRKEINTAVTTASAKDNNTNNNAGGDNNGSILLRRRINALKNLDDQISLLEHQYREDVLSIERQYDKKIAERIRKQELIINGQREPTDSEARRDSDEEEEGETTEDVVHENDKGVPDYWLQAIANHPLLCSLVQSHDEIVLGYLENIKSVMLKDNPGFRLEFHFRKNPFFENRCLTREYMLTNPTDFAPEADFEFKETRGCIINWKKDQSGRREHPEMPNSFFGFFEEFEEPPENSSELPLEDQIQENYEIGILFRSLTRHSVQFFSDAVCYESEHEEDDWEDDESEYEEDDYLEEYDEDEAEEEDNVDTDRKEVKGKGTNRSTKIQHERNRQSHRDGHDRNNRSGTVPSSKGDKPMTRRQQQPPECKQQ